MPIEQSVGSYRVHAPSLLIFRRDFKTLLFWTSFDRQ